MTGSTQLFIFVQRAIFELFSFARPFVWPANFFSLLSFSTISLWNFDSNITFYLFSLLCGLNGGRTELCGDEWEELLIEANSYPSWGSQTESNYCQRSVDGRKEERKRSRKTLKQVEEASTWAANTYLKSRSEWASEWTNEGGGKDEAKQNIVPNWYDDNVRKECELNNNVWDEMHELRRF